MSTSEINENNNLKKIRQDKGLSLTDVASKLKLTSDIIRKIENSEFNDLGAYTYIRGYVMHYTELLGVNADKYLDLIPKSKLDVPLVNTSSKLTKGIKLKRQSQNMASYVLGTSIVLVISFSGWYLLKNYSGFSRNKQDNIEIVNKGNLEITPKTQSTLDAGNLGFEENKKDNTNEESFHYSSLIPSSEVVESNLKNELPVSPITNTTDTTIGQTEDIKIDSVYEIYIEVLETSWVKIEHLDGNKLHNDLFKPGQMTFSSDQPIHFRIGNKNNVKVTINGQQIELSQYSRKNIADFNWPSDS